MQLFGWHKMPVSKNTSVSIQFDSGRGAVHNVHCSNLNTHLQLESEDRRRCSLRED